MSEVTIEPTPLVWMGRYENLPETPDGWPIGWAFYGLGHDLSEHYRAHVASIRPPISVAVPVLRHWPDGRHPDRLGSTVFCIDSHPSDDVHGAWQVTVDMASLVVGQQPLITVSPSIHLVGIWHGWLDQGVLHN